MKMVIPRAQKQNNCLTGRGLAAFILAAMAAIPLHAETPAEKVPNFFDESPVAMLLVASSDGQILAANNAAQLLYHKTSKQFQKLSVSDLNQLPGEMVREQIDDARTGRRHYFLFPRRIEDGSVQTMRMFAWPIRTKDGTALISIIDRADDMRTGGEPLATYSSNLIETIRQKSDELQQTDGLLYLTFVVAIAVLCGIIVILGVVLLRGRKLVRALSRQHLLMRVVIDAIPDQIYFKRQNGKLETCNQAAAEFVGMPAEMIIGKTDREIFGQNTDPLLQQHVFSDVQNESNLHDQGEVTSPTGRKYTLEMTKAPVIDADGERLGSISVWRDITAHRQTEARVEMLSDYDPLTKLANRTKAQEVFLGYLAEHQFKKQFMAIAIFDLDSFASVNSIFGHNIGDTILKTTGRRLISNLDPGCFAARLSSDEFVVFLTMLGTAEEVARTKAHEKVQRLQTYIARQTFIKGNQITPSTSAGVVLVEPTCEAGAEALRRADLAMHEAKARDRGGLRWFHSGMVEDLVARFDVETVLEKALQQGHFRLYLQPKVTEHAMGRHFEALIRLDHPERGIVEPGSFIDVAEATGLIVPIGAWILEESCKLLAEHEDLHLAVNVSVRQFLREDFVDGITSLLKKYQFEPERLTLEMTESLMIANSDLALLQLKKIRDLKVKLSIDDFGTGYSALVYLKQFPLDELKIDKTFIAGVPHDSSDTSLVELIITMAHHLGISIVAEGVETPEQEAWLRGHGCESLQGYLFSQPKPAEYFLSPQN